MPKKQISKLTFNIPADEIDQLKKLAKRLNITVTAALRRAIAFELYMTKETDSGSKILLEDSTGKIFKVTRN